MMMLKIGELAKRHAIKADTLRFYEKNGLLHASQRSESGYRSYTESDSEKLAFIIRAKRVGFSLQEIADLLEIQIDRQNHHCSETKAIVDSKKRDVEERIQELTRFKHSLELLGDSCCGGEEPATHCSILEALNGVDKEVML
jgi:MerR family Zn(II)-responsive transcriptional regulator of zntA